MSGETIEVSYLWRLETKHLVPEGAGAVAWTLCKLDGSWVEQATLDALAKRLTGMAPRLKIADLPLCKRCAKRAETHGWAIAA